MVPSARIDALLVPALIDQVNATRACDDLADDREGRRQHGASLLQDPVRSDEDELVILAAVQSHPLSICGETREGIRVDGNADGPHIRANTTGRADVREILCEAVTYIDGASNAGGDGGLAGVDARPRVHVACDERIVDALCG